MAGPQNRADRHEYHQPKQCLPARRRGRTETWYAMPPGQNLGNTDTAQCENERHGRSGSQQRASQAAGKKRHGAEDALWITGTLYNRSAHRCVDMARHRPDSPFVLKKREKILIDALAAVQPGHGRPSSRLWHSSAPARVVLWTLAGQTWQASRLS